MNFYRTIRKKKIWKLPVFVLFIILAAGFTADLAGKHLAEKAPMEEQPARDIDIPPYQGEPVVTINGGQPLFTESEYTTVPFETYSELDILGRCGPAYANICKDLMPEEERGEIGSIKPSGWHTVRYPGIVEGDYLYNRCHLIAYQLAGENDNEKNLVTGTRYMNIEGMQPLENKIYEYAASTGYHVLYRVTPVYEENELVARGVRMEALSVEDKGSGLCFHIFAYNVQPHIVIDYATGESRLEETEGAGAEEAEAEEAGRLNLTEKSEEAGEPGLVEEESEQVKETGVNDENTFAEGVDYVINKNTKKFHLPSCDSVDEMSEKNKKYYTGDRETLIEQGYSPCHRCNP